MTSAVEGSLARTESRLVGPRSAWVTAGVGFSLCWLTLVGLAVLFRVHQVRPDLSGIDPVLVSLAAVGATLLGALMVAQCRVARGQRSDFWMGLGLVLYGSVVLVAGGLIPLGRDTTPGLVRYLPPVTAGGAIAQLTLAAAWVAIVILLLGRRPFYGTRRPPQFAVAIAALGLAQAHVAGALSLGAPSLWVLGSRLFQLIGFAVALPMIALEFEHRVIDDRLQLFNSLIDARTDSARHWAHQSIGAAYDHELRSTLLLLNGSVRMLVDRFDGLSASDRATFGQLIASSLERLGVLLNERADEGNEFELREVVHSVVCGERSSGVVSTFDLQPSMACSGRSADVAGVLHMLIRNTWARCQPSAVHITGWSEGESIVLSIGPDELADQPVIGYLPQVDPTGSRERFAEAVDLEVAGQLLNSHQGTICSFTDAVGRASFELRLPTAHTDWRELEGVR